MTTMGGGVFKLHVGFNFRILSTSPLTAPCIFIGQLERKPSESCQKDVKDFNNGTTLSAVKDTLKSWLD